MSLRRFVAVSRVWIIGFGLYARCDTGTFCLSVFDVILESKNRGAALAKRSDSGEDLGGVYEEWYCVKGGKKDVVNIIMDFADERYTLKVRAMRTSDKKAMWYGFVQTEWWRSNAASEARNAK